MSEKMRAKDELYFERVLLGLPRPLWTPVACHWQITRDLMQLGTEVMEIHYFHTMLPELLSPSPYIAIVHSGLLDLSDIANCDRATLIKLAILLPKSRFVVWDNAHAWEPSDEPLPKNLEVWTDIVTFEVTERILILLGNLVHINGHPGRKKGSP